MKLTAQQRILLWLSQAKVPALRVDEIREKSGGLESLWKDYGLLKDKLFTAAEIKRLSDLHSDAAMEDIIALLCKKGVHLLYREDTDFPSRLRELPDAPYLLYYAGDRQAFQTECIALIGTRRASSYGREMAESIACGLAKAGITIVSGLAYGIDEAAHLGALRGNGQTIGILGSGLNVPYPPDHLELMRQIAGGKGAVVSEYPLDTEPLKYHFPYRNRIISGMSIAVVFVEGKIRSGGMRTVDAALNQGREVFAVPGPVGKTGSEGPHQIIRDGARLVTCAEDILEDLKGTLYVKEFAAAQAERAEKEEREDMSPLQCRIADELSIESLSAEELARKLHINEDEILSELGLMEITGTVLREAGNRFRSPLKHTRSK